MDRRSANSAAGYRAPCVVEAPGFNVSGKDGDDNSAF